MAPGVASVEVDFRRGSLTNQPTLSISDLDGKRIAIVHAWAERGDLIAIELPEDRRNFGDEQHGLGNLTDPGQWFGLKLVVDTLNRTTQTYVRSGRGRWVPLNKRPFPFYDPAAKGTTWFLGLGTYKHKAAENNTLDSRSTEPSHYQTHADDRRAEAAKASDIKAISPYPPTRTHAAPISS